MIDCQPVNVCTWMDVNVNPGFINPWAVELGETQTVMILKMIPLNYRKQPRASEIQGRHHMFQPFP